MLGGLTLWAGHFFLLYGIGSVWPGTRLAPALVIGATVMAAAGALFLALANQRQSAGDEFEQWKLRLSRAGALIALVGIVWQGLPALAEYF